MRHFLSKECRSDPDIESLKRQYLFFCCKCNCKVLSVLINGITLWKIPYFKFTLYLPCGGVERGWEQAANCGGNLEPEDILPTRGILTHLIIKGQGIVVSAVLYIFMWKVFCSFV